MKLAVKLTMKFIVAILCMACVGCQSFSKAGASSVNNSSVANWQRILHCSGGDATIDVDVNQRTNLQIVARNSIAFPFLDQMPWGQIKNDGERIYQGQSPYGIFAPNQFRHFRRYEVVTDSAGRRLGFEVLRNGSTVTFRSLDLQRPGCSPGSSQGDDYYPSSCEVQNYVFKECY